MFHNILHRDVVFTSAFSEEAKDLLTGVRAPILFTRVIPFRIVQLTTHSPLALSSCYAVILPSV